jgi:hypothetical protein
MKGITSLIAVDIASYSLSVEDYAMSFCNLDAQRLVGLDTLRT